MLVIESDRGDHRDIRVHDIDGVQTPAQTDFENGHVDRGAAKQPQRGQGRKFKVGQGHAAASLVYGRKSPPDGRVGGGLAIHGNALVETP